MEKRNFVTSVRTAEDTSFGDDLVGSAANMFSRSSGKGKTADVFEKRASAEDEKTDRSI